MRWLGTPLSLGLILTACTSAQVPVVGELPTVCTGAAGTCDADVGPPDSGADSDGPPIDAGHD